MKRFLILALALLPAFSCTQETNLSISPDVSSFLLGPSGGEFDVVVFTNGYWKASCSDGAVSFAPDSGNFTLPMHVVVGPNEENYTKSVKIELKTSLDGNSRTSRIAITQTCEPFIFSEISEVQLGMSGGLARFTVNSNADWRLVSTSLDGIPFELEVDPQEHGPNSVTVSVRVPENLSGAVRNFAVFLALRENPETSLELRIRQEG